MKASKKSLQKSVAQQREALMDLLQEPLGQLAEACCAVWGEREKLNALLGDALKALPFCKHLYAINTRSVQVSDNVSQHGLLEGFGRDRSKRPYLKDVASGSGLILSDAYISLRERRPSLTAIQAVHNRDGKLLGFIGAYFGLRDLPLARELYEEPRSWRQIKGDPSIRGTVFHQTRTESEMDRYIDTMLGVMAELMLYHGVFHVILHFSSSRAIIWLVEDPYRYRLLDINELIDPDTCLAYPRRPYPADALVPAEKIREVLDAFRGLRLLDEMFYLRSGTLNIFNGIVGLTFSCDGSHYIPYDEFLKMDSAFWMGAESPEVNS